MTLYQGQPTVTDGSRKVTSPWVRVSGMLLARSGPPRSVAGSRRIPLSRIRSNA